MTPEPDKAQLRLRLQAARQKLSREEVRSKSLNIIEQVEKLMDWPNIQAIHCYISLPEQKEVDTKELFEFVWHRYPTIRIYTAKKDGVLTRVHPDFRLEPAQSTTFDAVIVPTLGFDGRLHRLGYGGGYYDRFLATQPDAQKIGLAYEIGKLRRIPAEPTDIALDMVVTERLEYNPSS